MIRQEFYQLACYIILFSLNPNSKHGFDVLSRRQVNNHRALQSQYRGVTFFFAITRNFQRKCATRVVEWSWRPEAQPITQSAFGRVCGGRYFTDLYEALPHASLLPPHLCSLYEKAQIFTNTINNTYFIILLFISPVLIKKIYI